MPAIASARFLLAFFLGAGLLALSCGAQQGDREGHKMIDPIPLDQIPPSPYLGLSEALKSFKVAPGFVVEPVAHGKDVDLAVALSFDANGRAWTCEMRGYMPNLDGKGEQNPTGRIRVLEDTDGDGKIDRSTVFLDGLVLPRAVAVTSDGCLYTSGDVLYFTKRKGLKPVGKPLVVDRHYAVGGNPEHKANGLLYGHDNWYYNAKSGKRYRRLKGKWVHQKTNIRGQWGIAKDNAGRLYHNNNSVLLVGDVFPPMFFRGNPHFTPKIRTSFQLGTNRTHPIHMTPGVNRGYMKGVLDENGRLVAATAASGMAIYRGDNFPASAVGMAFVTEPAADLVKAVEVERDEWNHPRGSHPYEKNEFLASRDEWFLPCNIYTAPDGTLWIVDMYFGLLQHKTYMTTYLRKQYQHRGLDKPKPFTGRIYRVRYKKNNVSPVPRMEGLPASALIGFLSHANGTVRDTAQRLIVESGDPSVADALANLASDSGDPMAQIHAMWTLDGLGLTSAARLVPPLNSKRPDVVNNALDIIARRRISDSSLVKSIAALPDSPPTLPAKVRAMAAANMEDQALRVTLENPEAPYLREAFVSGLGVRAAAFRDKHRKISDEKLDQLLTASARATMDAGAAEPAPGAHLKGKDLASFKRGKAVYITKAACFGCHGEDGAGLDNLGPPLVESEWVIGDPDRLAKILLHGMVGPLVVNGKKYRPAAAMPGLNDNGEVTDQDLADVMTYVRNNWGNRAPPVSAGLVQKTRAATKGRGQPFRAADLAK